MVTWGGKSYYSHHVAAGETLYSICRAYGVTVEEVMALNEKTTPALSIGEVLRIPVVQPFVRLDKKFYYHRMAAGETLFSLSRKFGVKVKRILKDNPELSSDKPIAVGTVVRLTLRQIDRDALAEELRRQDQAAIQVQRELPPAVDSLPRQPLKADTLLVPAPEVVDSGRVKVALLLPLHVDAYKLPSMGIFEQDTAEVKAADERWRLNRASEPFVQLYEAVLLAADSLKRIGCPVDLHVFDTRRSVDEARRLAGELNMLSPDLILGPVYPDIIRALANGLGDRTVPMVLPFVSKTEDVRGIPNAVQLNEGKTSLLADMAAWIGEHAGNARLVQLVLDPAFAQGDLAQQLINRLPQRDSVERLHWIQDTHLDSLRQFFKKGQEYLILFPTTNEAALNRVLPVLSALSEDYRLSIVGLPDWMRFTSLDEDVFFRLNTSVFVNTHVDYESPAARAFAERYRAYFHEEFSALAYRLYDAALYFIHEAWQHPHDLLEHLQHAGMDGLFTRFRFTREPATGVLENRGLYLVTYGRDYTITVAPVH